MSKVLIIDDEEDIRDIVKMILEGEFDCDFLQAASGNQAVEILGSDEGKEVKAIISDYTMNDGNGSVVYNYNKNESERKPFCFLSGGYLEDYKDLDNFEVDSDMDHYLHKPIDHEQLISTFKFMMSLGDQTAEGMEGHADYKKVHIWNLQKFLEENFDLYIKLSDEKFVKVVRGHDL